MPPMEGRNLSRAADDSVASCMQQQVPNLGSVQAARRKRMQVARTQIGSPKNGRPLGGGFLVHCRALTQQTTRDILNDTVPTLEW